jgi:hypothetical protein
MDLRKIGWEGVDWMHMAQNRDQWQALVTTAINLQVQKKQNIFRLTISFSRRTLFHGIS